MIVASLIPECHHDAVRRASPASAIHIAVSDADELVSLANRGACSHVLIDPELIEEAHLRALVIDVARHGLELLLIGALSRRCVAACLAVTSIRPTSILFTTAGELAWLRAHLRGADGVDAAACVLHRLQVPIGELPMQMRIATVSLFSGGDIPRHAADLGRLSGTSVKTVRRWYTRVGLAGAGSLLGAAKLTVAWRLARSTRLSMNRIAGLAGFGSPRTLSRACERLGGCHPLDLRHSPAELLAGRVVDVLLV
jgi:AraC-like DNA-binding protein